MYRCTVITLALVVSGCDQAATFNLTCSGTEEHSISGRSTTEPYSVTYRVDTASQLWCVDNEKECQTPQKISEMNDSFLIFADKKIDNSMQYFRYIDEVNRVTGKHIVATISGREDNVMIINREGVCKSSAFSGFPETNPKF